jgi:hypothetical protein
MILARHKRSGPPYPKAVPHKVGDPYLSLAEFAREAGVPQATIRRKGERYEILRSWQDYRSNRPPRWVYGVCDLPEESGSQFLIARLEKEACSLREQLRKNEERLERVMFHRRVGGAA